jgi:hypothetical protein
VRVLVTGCTVRNDGWSFEPAEPRTPPSAVSIRGYAVGERACGLEVELTEPGEYELSGEGVLRRLDR